MFKSGPQYPKLKTNFRLAINRLKLLEKKKTEMAQKARKEIADFITGNKEDRARIRVEHIIREDYTVEAYELIEMYMDLLLARFGLIQQMKDVDPGLEEAINSVLWAAPRLVADVQEFKVIGEQLTLKYGKPFAEACRSNQFDKVNPKLVHKMSVAAPPKILVERYMIEIAKSHNVPFAPDPNVMREDEVAAAEAMLIDFHNQAQPGGPQAQTQGNFAWMYPNPNQAAGDDDIKKPPPPPDVGGASGGGGGGVSSAFNYPQPPPYTSPATTGAQSVQPPAPPAAAFNYPTQSVPTQPMAPPSVPSNDMNKVPITGGVPSAPPPMILPQLPDVPFDDEENNAPNADDLDFDDLSRRFNNLKKR